MTSPDATPPPSDDELAKIEANQRDVALMLRVKEGDVEAFEQLIEIHQGPIVGTVSKMLGGASDSEDIAQQVFLRIWKSAARYEPTAKFTTWMFTITRNLVFNETRRRQRKPTISSEELEESVHWEAEDRETISPDQGALNQELEGAINKAIETLPEKQRLAVVLRRYEEMPYEDISRILDVSIPALKSLLFRARGQLKEALQQYLDE